MTGRSFHSERLQAPAVVSELAANFPTISKAAGPTPSQGESQAPLSKPNEAAGKQLCSSESVSETCLGRGAWETAVGKERERARREGTRHRGRAAQEGDHR